MPEGETVHASCVVLGEDAVLVRGAPGSGKSSLCRALIASAEAAGHFARLVSDDRTRLEAKGGRLVARAMPATAGLIETRGLGIHPVAHEPAARVRLLVDLVAREPVRMPEEEDLTTTLCGIAISSFRTPAGRTSAEAVLTRLRQSRQASKTHS